MQLGGGSDQGARRTDDMGGARLRSNNQETVAGGDSDGDVIGQEAMDDVACACG